MILKYMLALAVAALVLPGPAAAYPSAAGGFADGRDIVQLSFDPLTNELVGPSLRLLTNSTITAGSIEISPSTFALNTTLQEASTSDFAAGVVKDGVRVSSGTVALDYGSSLQELNAGNAFGNATLSSLVINGTRLEVQAGSSGWFETSDQTAPRTGWGVVRAFGGFPAGSAVQVDVLAPGGATLVADQRLGQPLAIDAIANPTVRFHVTLTGLSPAATPWLQALQVGQSFGDTPAGAGGGRVTSNVTEGPNGGLSPNSTRDTFARYSSNPVLSPAGGTWYADTLTEPFLIPMGSEIWMYVSGRATPSGAWHIGRARSVDGSAWSIDPAPLLNGTAGQWDAPGVWGSFILPNPVAAGYVMYYGSYNASSGRGQMGRATSLDGITWAKDVANPVLSYGPGSWDGARADPPVGVRYQGGNWTLWYAGGSIANGGGRLEMGIATSSDGVNWTKYAGNPVQTKSGASYEAGDTASGHMVFDGATSYYYYGCNPSSYWQECMSSSTDGGYTWTKQGVVLQRVAGTWEQGCADVGVLLLNGSVLMIYTGFNTYGQLGRADSVLRVGHVAGQADLGAAPPRALGSARIWANLTSGSYASTFLSSSTDGISWSAWENVTVGQISTTAAARFFRWQVDFSGPPITAPPVFWNVSFSYTTFYAQGVFVSRNFTFAEALVGAALAAGPASSSGSVQLAFSVGGAPWTGVIDGAWVAFAPTQGSLAYRITMEGTSSQSPVVDWVNLTVERIGAPENVTVRVGVGGAPFFSQAGAFGGGLNVSLPVADLNALINQTRTSFPSASTVDVPLVVTSTHFGAVILASPRLAFTLSNPLSASFDPTTPSVSMAENSSVSFAVAADSPYAPLDISWDVDGSPVQAAGGGFGLDFVADFNSAGAHSVTCSVSNGDATLEFTWNVTVTNVNRPPGVGTTQPTSPISVSHTGTVEFVASAVDPDGDSLTLAWKVDGAFLPEHGGSLNLTALAPGAHNVQFSASDGVATVSFAWAVQATDATPKAAFMPVGDSTVSHAGFVLFQANATDADGDLISYAWWLDGSQVSNTGATYNLSRPATGTHRVEVKVTSFGKEAAHVWNVTATNGGPVLLSRDPLGSVELVAGNSATFRAVAEDPDGDPLTMAWTLDGAPISGSGGQAVLPAGTEPGAHTMRYEARDADGANTSVEWTVSVLPQPVPPSSTEPGLPLVVLVAAAIAAAATVIVLLRRRKAKAE